jgi:hypothetical protein
MRTMKTCLVLLAATALGACVNQQELTKREIQKFMQQAVGEFKNEAGEQLVMVPVYSRMIGMDTVYVERTTAAGTSGRIVSLEVGKNGIVQLAYVFVQQNQWRNLRENPELFSALLPKDVRPAGTCDIKIADDRNSVTYTCGGAPPTSYQRVVHEFD